MERMNRQHVLLLLLWLLCGEASIYAADEPWVYDGFNGEAGEFAGATGGYGWRGGWKVEAEIAWPFRLSSNTPMVYSGLSQTGAHALIGRGAVTRPLDVAKHLGQGNELWLSFLYRSEVPVDAFPRFVLFKDGPSTPIITVGRSVRTWALTLHNDELTTQRTPKDVVPYRSHLIVLQLQFGETSCCNLFIDPTPGKVPTADATVTSTGKNGLAFQGLAWVSDDPKTPEVQAGIDEVRMGPSFASVVPVPSFAQAPTAAPALKAVGNADGASLSWNALKDAQGYVLQRRDANALNFMTCAADVRTLSHVDAIFGADRSADYRVAAHNAKGTGPWSAPVSVTLSHRTAGFSQMSLLHLCDLGYPDLIARTAGFRRARHDRKSNNRASLNWEVGRNRLDWVSLTTFPVNTFVISNATPENQGSLEHLTLYCQWLLNFSSEADLGLYYTFSQDTESLDAWLAATERMVERQDEMLAALQTRFPGQRVFAVPMAQALKNCIASDPARLNLIPQKKQPQPALLVYLASCVHYAATYHRSPMGLPADALSGVGYTVTKAEATAAQQAAWEAVRDHPQSHLRARAIEPIGASERTR